MQVNAAQTKKLRHFGEELIDLIEQLGSLPQNKSPVEVKIERVSENKEEEAKADTKQEPKQQRGVDLVKLTLAADIDEKQKEVIGKIDVLLEEIADFPKKIAAYIKAAPTPEMESQLGSVYIHESFTVNGYDARKQSTNCGYTPLMIAAKYGLTNVVRKLINAEAKADRENLNQGSLYDFKPTFTALTLAAEFGHVDVVKLLLPISNLLLPGIGDRHGYKTSFLYSILKHGNEAKVLDILKTVNELLTNKEIKDDNNRFGHQAFKNTYLSLALLQAVSLNMEKVVEQLFTMGVQVDSRFTFSSDKSFAVYNVFDYALAVGNIKIVKMLLAYNRGENRVDLTGDHLLSVINKTAILKLLISSGAPITKPVLRGVVKKANEMKEPDKTNFLKEIFDNVSSYQRNSLENLLSRELQDTLTNDKPDVSLTIFLVTAGARIPFITPEELIKKFSHLPENAKKELLMIFIKAGLNFDNAKSLDQCAAIFKEEEEFLSCLETLDQGVTSYDHGQVLLLHGIKIASQKNWLKVMQLCQASLTPLSKEKALADLLESEFLTVEKLKVFRNEYLAVPNPIQVVLENEKLKPQKEIVREIIKELIANKVPVPHQVYSNGISHPTLNVLVERADPLLLELFLEQKLPVNECNSDEDERTPLLTAMMVSEINIDIVQQLLKHSAIVDKMDNDGNHPLAFALCSQNKTAIDLLKPKTDLRLFVQKSNFSIRDLFESFESEDLVKLFYGLYVSVKDLIPYIDFNNNLLLLSLLNKLARASVHCAHLMCMEIMKYHAKKLSFDSWIDVFNCYTRDISLGFTKQSFNELLTTIDSHDLLQKLQVTVHNKEKNDMCTQRLALLNKRKDSEIKRLQHVIQSEVKMQLASEQGASMKPDLLMLPKNIQMGSEKSWSMLALTYNQTISLMEDKTKKPTIVNFSQNIVDKVKEIKLEELTEWPLDVAKPLLLFVLKVDLKYQTKHFLKLQQKLTLVEVSKECLRWLDACKPSDIIWDKDYLNDICKYLIERQHQGKDLELLIRLWDTLAASKKLDEPQLHGLTQKFINSLMDLNVDVFKQWSSPALAKLLNWIQTIEARYKTTGCTIKLFEKIHQAGCWDCLLYPPEEKTKPLIHSWVRSNNDPQISACMKLCKENFRTARYTVSTVMGMHNYKLDDLELGENNLCGLLDLYFACEKFAFEARQSQQKDKLKLIAQFKVFIFKICAFYSDNDKTRDTGSRSQANDTWQIDLDYELNVMLGMAKENPVLFNLLERFKKEHHSVELLIAHDKSSSMPKTQDQVVVANGSEIKETPKIIETSDKESVRKEVKTTLPHQEFTISNLEKLEFSRLEKFLLKRHQTNITDILNGMKKIESELSSGLIAPPNSPVKGATYLAPTSMSSAATNSHRSGVTAPPNSPANIQDTSFSPKLTP